MMKRGQDEDEIEKKMIVRENPKIPLCIIRSWGNLTLKKYRKL